MLTGLRILIVDDDLDQTEMYAVAFGAGDAEVFAVASVAEARAALEHERFDVLISDIVMPDSSGYGLVRWLRASAGANRAIPAIALTGHASEHDRDEAIAAGFDEHRAKPCELKDLFAVILRLLRRRGASG
jgi:CheY-like chemotaxis protein